MPRQRKYHTEEEVRAAFAQPEGESRLEREVRLRKMAAVLYRVRARQRQSAPDAWTRSAPAPAVDGAPRASGDLPAREDDGARELCEVKQEPVVEEDNDESNGMFLEQCSIIKKEEMEDVLEEDSVAYGEMQNEEVLPDSSPVTNPVPVGCPIRVKVKCEEDPTTLKTFTVMDTAANNSTKVSDYILPDDGAVFPLILAQQREVVQSQKSQHAPACQETTPTQNQESPKTPTTSQLKLVYTPVNTPDKSPYIDISPVSNENLSEKAKEVLKRLARICPKVNESTQNIVRKNVQNSVVELDNQTNYQTRVPSSNHQALSPPQQMKEVPVRLEIPSKSQAWGSVVVLGTVTGLPYSSQQSQNQMLTLGPVTVSTQQQELGQLMPVATVPVSTHQGLSQMTSTASVPAPVTPEGLGQIITVATNPVTTQQQGLNQMMSVGTVPGLPKQQGLGQMISVATEHPATQQQGLNQMMPIATVPTQPNQQWGPVLTIRTLTTPSNQQSLGSLGGVSNMQGQTCPQIVAGHTVSLGGMPAQTQDQALGKFMPVATVPATTHQGSGQMMSLAANCIQAQQNVGPLRSQSDVQGQTCRQVVMGHAIALGSMPAQTQEQSLGKFMPVATVPATTHQGSGQMSLAARPVHVQQGLGQIITVATDPPTTQQQGLKQMMPISTLPVLPKQQGLGQIFSVASESPTSQQQVIFRNVALFFIVLLYCVSVQGLNQMMSIATVPAQAKEQSLVSVKSVGTMSMPASHQVMVPVKTLQPFPQKGLHHLLPVEALTTSSSAPLQVSASGSLQAQNWTTTAPHVAPLLSLAQATKQVNGQAPALLQILKPIRAQLVDTTVATAPPLPRPVQPLASVPIRTPATPHAVATESEPVPIKTPLLLEALSSVLKGTEEQVKVPTPIPTPAPVRVSSVPTGVSAVTSMSQEEFKLRLPVKTYAKRMRNENTKALGPVLSQGRVLSSELHQGTAGRLLKIALSDYSHLIEGNCIENTRTDQKKNVGK